MGEKMRRAVGSRGKRGKENGEKGRKINRRKKRKRERREKKKRKRRGGEKKGDGIVEDGWMKCRVVGIKEWI